jgi:hypothetical protein
MKIEDVRRHLTTPLTTPAYAPMISRFTDREYLNIVYRTDADALRAVVPEPLRIDEPLVRFEVMKMGDVTGSGPYTEAAQAIPVSFDGERCRYPSTWQMGAKSEEGTPTFGFAGLSSATPRQAHRPETQAVQKSTPSPGDMYGASDFESVLGDHGCRQRSPAGIEQVGMEASWGRRPRAAKRFVGCRRG